MSSTGRRCLVAVCHNGASVPTKTVQSLMELGWGNRIPAAKDAHGFDAIDVMWSTSFPRVDALRDSAATLAIAEGFSHLLFLDADMVWPTDLLSKLLAHHDKGIVSGLYVMRHPPFAPVALTNGVKMSPDGPVIYTHTDTVLDTKELVECQVVGMGCTLVPVDVFAKIGPRPWFEYANDETGWPTVTEDVPFCQKAAAAGVSIYLDPTIKCGHVSASIVDDRTARRYRDDGRRAQEKMPITLVELGAA